MKSNILPALREFAANRKKELTAVLCAVLILGLVLASVWAVSERRKDPSGWDNSKLTEGIPEFPGEPYSFTEAGVSCAAYYEDVSGEEIFEYAALLKERCGIDLTSGAFPRAAEYGERTIILHYNVTEKYFSVTITGNGADTNDENQKLDQSGNN
ncbi:MAG: hypothetical protein J5925_00040 [Clostridia bacterium]|nr:hypothetical protein [Clostridia bacterium]